MPVADELLDIEQYLLIAFNNTQILLRWLYMRSHIHPIGGIWMRLRERGLGRLLAGESLAGITHHHDDFTLWLEQIRRMYQALLIERLATRAKELLASGMWLIASRTGCGFIVWNHYTDGQYNRCHTNWVLSAKTSWWLYSARRSR